MSAAVSSCNLSPTLIKIDQISDYIPGVSTVTNLVDLIEKCVVRCGCHSAPSVENHYFCYIIETKSILRCILLLVPILGNIIIGVYDLVQRDKNERATSTNQDLEASRLGIDVALLPKSLSEREQILETKRKEKIEEEAQEYLRQLDLQIVALKHCIEKFHKLVDNPEEPLELRLGFGSIKGTFNGTQMDKINYYWLSLKLLFSVKDIEQAMLNLSGLNSQEEILQKQQEITKFRSELLELRCSSYRDFLEKLDQNELLEKAKEFYLKSFSSKERNSLEESVLLMEEEQILTTLKQRCLEKKQEEYEIVEIQEIISIMERSVEFTESAK